jgi:hypothetical protein
VIKWEIEEGRGRRKKPRVFNFIHSLQVSGELLKMAFVISPLLSPSFLELNKKGHRFRWMGSLFESDPSV